MSQTNVSEVHLELRRLTRHLGGSRIAATLVLINLAVYFMRPQDIGPLGFLGTIRFPMFFGIIVLLAWLMRATQGWTYQTRVMMVFLLFEGVRTVIGKVVWESLVINDFWAYNIWKDFFLQFCTLIFPFVVFINNGRQLRRFLAVWLLIGVFLGIYTVTHGGRGPGGFLGDENDAGLAILIFLPFTLAFLTESRFKGSKKGRSFIAAAVTLVGIVATKSRGAFVGLVCVLAYFFWRSQRKLMLIFSGAILLAIVALFLPEDYVEEMRTIKDTSSGTAEIRKHYWSLALKTWLDPRHTLFGVGLGNVTFHLSNYETPEDLEKFPSSAGRAVHSLYFQLLPDLGLWGAIIVGLLTWRSFRTNAKLFVYIDRFLKELAKQKAAPQEGEEADERRAAMALLREELEFLKPMTLAVNVAFVAFFSAGAFISVMYYPMFWLLCALSAVLERYCTRLFALEEQLSNA